MSTQLEKVIIFDTTMRDGELMPGVQMSLPDKLELAQLLDRMGVDVIEVSYPGQSQKDFDEILALSQQIKNSRVCGLASPKSTEILKVAEGLAAATKGRIHTFANVNLKSRDRLDREQTLVIIRDSITLARNACEDVEWSAFDATRSEIDFLCKAIEVAITSGATTINIPDSLGVSTPETFSQLLQTIFNRVPNINRAVISVHCHDDLGQAVENSLAALACGARQIECAVNGLGARKGNADLETVVREVIRQEGYQVEIDPALLADASNLVTRIITENQVS